MSRPVNEIKEWIRGQLLTVELSGHPDSKEDLSMLRGILDILKAVEGWKGWAEDCAHEGNWNSDCEQDLISSIRDFGKEKP